MSDAPRRVRLADDQAEEIVLSCMMENLPGLWESHGRRLMDDLFDLPTNREVAHAMIDMHVSGLRVDYLTLIDWMRKQGTIQKVGGEARLTELFTKLSMTGGTLGMAPHYLKILEDFKFRRALLAAAERIAEGARDFTLEPKDCLEQTEAALFEMHTTGSHRGMVHIKTLMEPVLGDIDQTIRNRGHVTNGLATGFTSLDRMTMGLKPGLFVLAARPSRGKTVFGGQLCLNIGIGADGGMGDYKEFRQPSTPVGFFSLETSDHNLVKRFLLNLARINLLRARDGLISRAEQDGLKHAVERAVQSRIYVQSSYGMTIQELRAQARSAVRRFGLKAVVIDYLQLLKSSAPAAKQSRNYELADVSMGLKHMAAELEIPVIALAQLNREAEKSRRPTMADIRDSGQIEQDADYIATLCDPPAKLQEEMEENPDCPFLYVGLDLLKQKDGPTTTGMEPVGLKFLKEYFCMESVDDRLLSNSESDRQAGYDKPHQKPEAKRGRGRPRKERPEDQHESLDWPEDDE